MSTTIENIKMADLLTILQKKHNVQPEQKLNITFEIQAEPVKKVDIDDDVVNVGQDLLEGVSAILEAQEKGVELPDADDLLKEL